MPRVLTSLIALVVFASAGPAWAEPLLPVGPAGFSTSRFRLPADDAGIFDVEGGRVSDGLVASAGLWMGGAGASLQGAGDASVGGRALTGLTASVSVMGIASLSVETPLALDGAGAGDTRVAPKFPLLRAKDRGIDLAFVPAFTLPTGTHGSFLGDGLLTWAPELAMSKRWDRIRLAVNAGYHARPDQQVGDVKVGQELTGRLGLAWRPGVDGLEAALTFSGARALREGAASGAEALAGLSVDLFDGVSAFAGGGAALLGRYAGTPSWRAMAGMRWTGDLWAEAEPPAPPDRDGDGFADAVDKCPDDPEDPDGRFDDGCPDFDDDNDGVPDVADACPEKPGSPDNRGCPPRDSDGDGLADMEDNCPEEKGLFDGCKTPQLVRLRADRIDLGRPLTFEKGSAELTEDSEPLLDAVAKVVKAHPGIHLLRVEGHTDNRGRRSRNVELSQDRAKSVADALARRGLSPRRLSAVGYGPARPIDDNGTERGRATNRRVEIIIAAATPSLPDGAVVPEEDDLGPLAEDDFGGRSRTKRVDDTDRDLDDVLGSVF